FADQQRHAPRQMREGFQCAGRAHRSLSTREGVGGERIAMTRASNGRHPFWLLVMGLGVCRTAAEQSTDSTLPTSAPPFKQLRYNENYAYLRDTSRHSDYLDAIKFIPLNTNRDWYLTLGGEIRERYESYHNSLWGRGPQDDNGYLLQRYMVHADAHLGDDFRI